ncbi:ectoine hydroxylase-related dioxygenase (phytanoyl-CoA dioxygenase family) [Catenulispora sp. GP43]|uniref:phytanoyl-CoA dioxygenase family protein n=1 Tax=Catenulispora sp. GP43 TaxID=3156263 RepID=UPI0035118D19
MDLDTLLPGPDDVAFYRQNGYWVSPAILPGELLDAAERGMRRFYADDHDRALPDLPGTRGWRAEHGDVLRKNDYASLRVDELAGLVAHPAIAATAAVLAGADSIRLWHDQLLYKPVDAGGAPSRVGWHTDRQYWQSCSSDDMLTAWIGFHDVDEANGGVSFLPGSQQWDVTGLDFFSQDDTALIERTRSQGHSVDPVTPTLRRGQVSFHHCRTVHGSGLNHGSEPRRSLAVHLQPGDNRWVRRLGQDGVPVRHGNDDLVRTVDGVPDYSDPAICRPLWPHPAAVIR